MGWEKSESGGDLVDGEMPDLSFSLIEGDVLVELRRLAELGGVSVQEKLNRILREALFGNYEVELKKAYSEKEVEILDRLREQDEAEVRRFIANIVSSAKVEKSLLPDGKKRRTVLDAMGTSGGKVTIGREV